MEQSWPQWSPFQPPESLAWVNRGGLSNLYQQGGEGGRQLRGKFTFNLLASGMGFEGRGIWVESGPWHSHCVETYFRKTSSHLEDLKARTIDPVHLPKRYGFNRWMEKINTHTPRGAQQHELFWLFLLFKADPWERKDRSPEITSCTQRFGWKLIT